MKTSTSPQSTEPRLRDTLQARLIASHILVILFALGLVTIVSSIFLFRYERVAESQRLAQLAVPLLAEVNVVGNLPAEPRNRIRLDALDAQADAMDVRLLILDPDGTVRYDTSEDGSLKSQVLTEFSSHAAEVISSAQQSGEIEYLVLEPRGDATFAGHRVLIGAGRTGVWEARRALVIISDAHRYPLLGLFLPRLFIVAGLSLVIASLIGLLFSRRLAKPVHHLTLAADAMASGKLEQVVAGEGPDEIGRLVASFNQMSRQVATTHQSQRELLADVSHELRTPLTSVTGYARALRDGVIEDASQRDQALAVIGRESERMNALIGQLLDLTRLESGQSRLKVSAVPVGSLLKRVEERFRPEATQREIILTTASAATELILGDESRLLQILSNLVSNSLRFTPPGGLISISADSIGFGPTAAPAVRITVHDTGSGIAPDLLPVLFDRFTRGEVTEGSASSGFGLGLAIVKELVEMHRGAISVHSEPDRGATFTLDFPAEGN